MKTFPKALLVIDIQENLTNPDFRMHMDITNVDRFFKNVNKTVEIFEDAGLPVLYITNELTNFFLNWITGNVCKKGAKGVGPDPRLKRVNRELYRKSAKSAFANSKLTEDLRNWQVSEVCLVGLLAEHCVKATLTDALKNKFKVTVITDALGSKNEKSLNKSLDYYQRRDVNLVTADELFNSRNRMTA